MEAEHQTSLVGRIGWLIGSCLLAFVLYAASVGPLIYVLPRSAREGHFPILTMFYKPLVWVADHTPMGPVLEAYVTWWRELKGG